MTLFYALIASLFGLYIGKFLRYLIENLPSLLSEESDPERGLSDLVVSYFKKNFHSHQWLSLTIFDLALSALFALSTLLFPIGVKLFFVLIANAFLIGCFITDWRYKILPDNLTLSLMWLGLTGSLIPVFVTPAEAILGAVAGYSLFWLFNTLYRFFRGVEGMYPGDFKLNAAIGAYLGLQGLIPVVGISLFLLLVGAGASRILSKGQQAGSFLSQELPYGCSASVVALLYNYLILYSNS